jgi:hypothetical protein
VVCGAYLAVEAAILLLPDSVGHGLVGGLALLLCGFATVHALVAFRPGTGEPAPVTATDTNRKARADAEERMRLRREARKLCQDNPVLAQELKIGRPDLPRDYDDGGLVDVNHVPAAILAARLGLAPAEVATVSAASSEGSPASTSFRCTPTSRLTGWTGCATGCCSAYQAGRPPRRWRRRAGPPAP